MLGPELRHIMMVNRLTTGQLSYEASNDVAAAFGVTSIAWPWPLLSWPFYADLPQVIVQR
jgi:hypothetical protein